MYLHYSPKCLQKKNIYIYNMCMLKQYKIITYETGKHVSMSYIEIHLT